MGMHFDRRQREGGVVLKPNLGV